MDQLSSLLNPSTPQLETSASAALPLPNAARAAMENAHQAWSELPEMAIVKRRLHRERVFAASDDQDTRQPLDLMRTKVGRVMKERSWVTIGVTAPTAKCGTTTIALNLAMGLARLSAQRVIMLDLNFRNPRIGSILGAEPKYPLQELLAGRRPLSQCLLRHGTNLAVGITTGAVCNGADLLMEGSTREAMSLLKRRLMADVIVCDLGPMLAGDDVLAFLPLSDCTLLVVSAGRSRKSEVDVCERDLDAYGNLLGVVMNRVPHRFLR
ncbi:CpsD/CapB family tyrosine-protein kinase [Lutibaculum baratangense]|uniref:Exopolysaccharide biosynthesis n=1 Tax=Lutibaculum baratangense AMV1 TaxID=631454 RepID=V4RA60_9HYPH|nr:CpsD/CapB family tyrosine-protein kinase [Lutibaculum baratangense]ESR23056.1 exopolysaccharide biosynthesis [Lutibaculum baratangense AMV1]